MSRCSCANSTAYRVTSESYSGRNPRPTHRVRCDICGGKVGSLPRDLAKQLLDEPGEVVTLRTYRGDSIYLKEDGELG